jgi:hypothetical protein
MKQLRETQWSQCDGCGVCSYGTMWIHNFGRQVTFGHYTGPVVLACEACREALEALVTLDVLAQV